jgi:hypothetical protein
MLYEGCGYYFLQNWLVFDGFFTPLTVPRPLPERHGDSAMCCGFGVKVPRGRGKICATRWSPIFLLTINDRYRARFTPKPGHIALSPRRSGSLFCFFWHCRNPGN